MRKICLLILFFFSITILWGQNSNKITISFENINLEDAVLQLELKTNKTFYFDESWFTDKNITKNFVNQSLIEILSELLTDTSLNFYIQGNSVFLLKNTLIAEELPPNYFNDEKKEVEEKEAPIFQEEFVAEDEEITTGNTITIGRQRDFSKNQQFTLRGKITDTKSGAPLQDASISTLDGLKYAVTDGNGNYTLTLPSGINKLEINLLGYNTRTANVIMYGNGSYNFTLSEGVESLDEVIIESQRDSNVKDVVVGASTIDIEAIKTIPLVLGERDVLKVATTIPGIKKAGEGSSGYNVRGGRADQNLILLDDGVLYNPNHFLGFFSAVNPFTTGGLQIYKASIPAEYGGRLSSVFDIQTKSGNMEKVSGEGSIGPITGNLALEVPLVKNKASLIVGARATYSDYILRSLDEPSLKNSEASFYDAIVKYKHDFNENNSLQTTVYYSKDRFSITSDSLFDYSNAMVSLKYTHRFNDANSGDLLVTHSDYRYGILYEASANTDFDFGYKLNETQVKLNFNSKLNENHKLTYGLGSKLYNIEPGSVTPVGDFSDVQSKEIDNERALESAVYISDLFDITDKLSVDVGLRYSFYFALGPASQNIYTEGLPKNENTIVDVQNYNNNEVIETYGGPEYRLSARYLLGNDYSIKAAYNRTLQYLHLLSTNTTMSPTDIWKLSDYNIEPQKADQHSLGFYKNFLESDLELSLEGYYKKMQDLLDYKIGAQLILNDNLETELLQGEGKAYGVEFLLKKNKGNLNGYVGYSYSRTFVKLDSEIREEQVNDGDFFPANYDKPHDFSMVANYKLTKRYSISANFTYQTGRPITYPVARYYFAGEEQVLYSDRNQYRIPDYYRLDLGINIEGNHKKNKLAHSFINISVYNVLGRNNPYSVFFVNEEGQIKAFKTSIFSVPVPTITYNFKF